MHEIGPTPSYLRAVQSENWTVRGAISELIDNSFGPGRGAANMVFIRHDKTRRSLTIIDDGQGMKAVYQLFQLGAGAGRFHGDIGHYGTGGTKAILWLPSSVEIITMRADAKMSRYRMDWARQIAASRFFMVPDEWVDATKGNVPGILLDFGHGTLINMKLMRGRHFQIQPLIAELAQTYAPGLRSGKEIYWQTVKDDKVEVSISLRDHVVERAKYDDVIAFDTLVDVLGESLPVRGEFSLDPETPFSKSEVAIGFGHRVILKTRDCYSSPDSKLSFHGSGVSGWVDLGDGWKNYLSTTKDSFNHDGVRDALMAFIFERIRPLLEKTERSERQMILREIGISLTAALNSSASVKINFPDDPDTNEEPDVPEGDEVVDDNKSKTPDRDDRDDDEENEEPKPAVANVEIVEMTDNEMEGILCKIDIQRDSRVRALINGDHDFIKDSLLAKAHGRPALVSFIVHGISAAMVEDDNLLKQAFPRFRERQMIARFDGRSKEQFVTRCLIDRVSLSAVA